MYRTGMFPVLGGEDVIVEFDVDQTEGSVGFRLIRYHWGFWREHVWSEGVRKDQAGRFRIPVPKPASTGSGSATPPLLATSRSTGRWTDSECS